MVKAGVAVGTVLIAPLKAVLAAMGSSNLVTLCVD